MVIVEETTKWAGGGANHTYMLSNDRSKMFAYVKAGDRAVFKFKKPIRIDTRGRTFKVVPNIWDYQEETVASTDRWQVTGSKGDVYIIERTENGLTCSCSGFKFRGACKHTKESC
jgi:hypothetical protein